jgi:hypothetical protein
VKLLSSFLPFTLPFVPGTSDPVAIQYLLGASQELCERTRCWRLVIDEQYFEGEDQRRCGDMKIQGASVYEIEEAWFNNRKLRREQFSLIPAWDIPPPRYKGEARDPVPQYPTCDQYVPGYTPPPLVPLPPMCERRNDGRFCITQISAGSMIILAPQHGNLRVSMFLRPSEGATTVPDFVFDQFARPIADGAIARIKMIPGQPTCDPQGAQVHMAQFNAACDKHFAFNVRGQQRAKPRARADFY